MIRFLPSKIAIGLGGVFLVVATLMWYWNRTPPLWVEVQMSKLDTVRERVNGSGKIYPSEEIQISSEVSGEVRELFVKEGDSVKVGDLLARIRPDNLLAIRDRNLASLNAQKANYARAKAQTLQAKARLLKAELDWKRSQTLLDQKTISLQEYENFVSQYEIAKAEYEAAFQNEESARHSVASAVAALDEAEKNLKLTNIYAPISGIITKLSIKKGERVVGTAQMAGTEMMRIANFETMEVHVNINENDIIKIHLRDTAIVEVDAYARDNQKFLAVVTHIANSANQSLDKAVGANVEQVTEFTVRLLLLPDSYRHLLVRGIPPFRPGMTATVEITTDIKPNALVVPVSAVAVRNLSESENPSMQKLSEVVFVYDSLQSCARMRKVRTGISDFENIEILSGITEKELIIVAPFSLVSKVLKNGDKVRVKPLKDKLR
ncbi:MAG: efflux RND transporter periplasmic adaptor subunit [Cytophagales bacterium]|nr:efflux RND transporter periplasmic adaptor subunit [Cytophagales bacterium]MDW8384927.1 efflux RND transporter periplasmic adaptor subunit [Flammeovirgaceae bacterium]